MLVKVALLWGRSTVKECDTGFMSPYPVIATDLDGTLLTTHHTLTPYTVDTLHKAKKHGVTIVAVTARPPRIIDEWPILASVLDSAICSNGAIVYDPGSQVVEATKTMLAEAALATWKALTRELPGLTVAVETGFEVVAESAYLKKNSVGDKRVIVASPAEVFSSASQIVKLLVRDGAASADELLHAAREAHLPGVELSHSGGSGLLEISASGVSKAVTLAEWCAMRGVGAEDVIAFGDMPNDVPVLEWAGRSYAVGNAHPEALAAASAICDSNDDDGVARVIENLLS